MEWKTIETLPEEGERVLVFGNGEICTARFVQNHFFIDPVQGILSETISWEPTHWMPLPEPPIKEHYCTNKTKDWICRTNRNL